MVISIYNIPMDENLFPPSEFDAWATSYDQDVSANSGFPFESYRQVLDTVIRLAQAEPGMRVLDLGAGTGNLTELFVKAGCRVWGTDYSAEMVARARAKLPQVSFIQADLLAPWPKEFPATFDRIVSGYVFHHFTQQKKVELISDLVRQHLLPDGRIVIADIAFPTLQDQALAQAALGDEWEQEYFWIASEDVAALQKVGLKVSFEPVSPYAGVFCIES